MRILNRLLLASVLLVTASSSLASAPTDGAPVVVSFSPRLEAELRSSYGSDQANVLRDAITTSLGRALGAPAADPLKRVTVEVRLEWAKPTHPTPAQLARDPNLDAVRSISPGGADLTATLRAADGRELGRVTYGYYAPTVRLASPSLEPWADARRSIEGFAAAVAAKARAAG